MNGPRKNADADARLLRGLQVTAAPATVDVLGFSEFRTTQFGQPDEAELQTTARRVGRRHRCLGHLGKTDAVVERPVTTSTTWTNWYSRGRRTRTYTDTSTTLRAGPASKRPVRLRGVLSALQLSQCFCSFDFTLGPFDPTTPMD